MIIKTENAEFDSESIFTPIDVFTKKAEIDQFINKLVYISDNWEDMLDDIKIDYKKLLVSINTNPKEVAPFMTNDGREWTFCLPANAVKFKNLEPKKEYRPFETVDELYTALSCNLGSIITYRKKFSETHYTQILTGVMQNNGNLWRVIFSYISYMPSELFNSYEWKDDFGNWHTFGIEVKKGQENGNN